MDHELINALERCGKDPTRWIVTLWTWLETRLGDIDSRQFRLIDIRKAGLDPDVAPLDADSALKELREQGDVLGGAAACLVQLERWVAANGRPDTILSGPAKGIDGDEHYVTAWNSWLARTFWKDTVRDRDTPPGADYAPSMYTLAPRLSVVPALVDGVPLVPIDPVTDPEADRALHRAKLRFERIAASHATDDDEGDLVIHLAALGTNRLEGFNPDPQRKTFVYGDPPAGDRSITTIEEGLARAVADAEQRGAAILVLPEFAVPAASLSVLGELLAAADPAPALTVAGLRHIDVAAAGEPTHDEEGCALSAWANEAVVLGDDGTEIFRHRKLTAFTYVAGELEVREDSRLGKALPILYTAIGNVTVLTCLDTFATTIERVRKSPASVVLVPSLSPSVSPHKVALAEAVRWLWGAAFVCNRHPVSDGADAWRPVKVRPFWTVALLNGCVPAAELEHGPSFEFDLRREAAGHGRPARIQPKSTNSDADADAPPDS